MSEADEQKAVVRWFKRKYPEYKDCVIGQLNGAYYAGGSVQRAKQHNKNKSMGAKNGTSDIFFAVPLKGRHGLWVEMKDKGKTLCSVSKDQLEHIGIMNALGYRAYWCAGFDDAKKVIEEYMSPDYENV